MTEPDRTHSTPPTECAGLAAPATTDPITLGVIWGALQSIAVEIGTTVHKTAYSEQAREGQDFSVAVFDPEGRMVAQGPSSPGPMGAMPAAVRNAVAAHPGETLRPGDAILLNDPLLGSGHFPDFFITQPAFHEGALIGFVVNIVHQTDVGGSRPGSQGVEGIFDYFQEGLRIPPTKVWREYREDEGVVGIIAANTRTPDKVLGDLRAQRSALRVGELRLIELAQRYGRDTVRAAMDEIIARSEASVRAAIAKIPDGVYTFEDFLDDYGPGTEPLRVHVAAAASHSANPTFGGWDRARQRRFVAYELVLSGTGARATRDGCEGMSWAFNASNIPVEAQEATQPIVVEHFGFIRDSAGAGAFRGGCGIRRDLRFLADEGKLTNLSERQRFAPFGVFGGQPGRLARTVINPGPGEQTVHGKQSREFAYGDVLSFQQSGAGGYGDPLARDPVRVLDDVLDDYVSVEAAREEYGVVIVGEEIDSAATSALRASRRRT